MDDPRNRLFAAEHLCIGAASGALGAAMLVASFFTDSGRVAVVLAAAVVATAALVAHLTVVTRTASSRTADEWDLLVIDRSHQVRISATVGAVALLTLAAAM